MLQASKHRFVFDAKLRNAQMLKRHKYSIRQIAQILKVKKSNIDRWLKMDMSSEAILKRRLNKGNCNRIISGTQEKIAAGWVIMRSIRKQSCTTQDFKEFLHLAFDIIPSNSFITRFMNRNHLSLQDTSTAKGAEMMELKFKECVEFIAKLRELKKKPIQIAVIDKTKFYYDEKYVKTISIKGGGKRRVEKKLRGTPDCMYSMLVANGTLGDVYIESTTEKHVQNYSYNEKLGSAHVTHLHKDTLRRGETGYLNFLNYCIENELLVPYDVLISDNESSFKTKKVKAFLKENKIIPLCFPSYMNHLLSPCDNYFHASMKKRYWDIISKFSTLSYQEKIDSIIMAFYAEKKKINPCLF